METGYKSFAKIKIRRKNGSEIPPNAFIYNQFKKRSLTDSEINTEAKNESGNKKEINGKPENLFGRYTCDRQ